MLEYNTGGGIVGRNVYGKGIDEILMRTDPAVNGGAAFYYQHDHEGSVTHLTGTGGTVIEKYRYDVFGVPTVYDGSGNVRPGGSIYKNRFLFTGREYAASFGFYEYRARAYHPGLGRFMSEDPKLFDAGDYNLFRYCHNDPIDMTDPMGLLGNIWWRNMTPEVYAQMMGDATRRAMEGNFGAGAIRIGMSGYQEISQRGQSLTVAQTRQVQKGSDGRPALDRKVLGETKTATDMSIRAASHDTVPYQVVSYDKDGNQHYTEPARGKDLGLGRYEERSALLPEGAHVRGIGHYHPPGKASFSDKDMRNTVPVMKNRDGHPGLYDLYYRGWRFYFDQNLRPLGAFPYSG